MASAAPDTDSVSKGGKIAAALTCPVCLDLCSNPKILPQCGHSLCAACLEPIYKKYETVGKSTTTFPCPECRAENSVATGEIDKLKTNYPILRAVEVLRGEEMVAKSTQPGVACPHIDFTTKSNLSTCQHCEKAFCQSCLFGHMALIKLEINFLSSGLHDRFEGAQTQLPEKANVIRRQIDENVRLVQQKISADSEALLEALRKTVFENRDRLLEKAKVLGDELHNRLVKEVETNDVFSQQEALDRRLKELNTTSVLYSCLEDCVQLHQLVIDQDLKISKLEHVDQSQVAKSNITFTSNQSIIDSVIDLLANASDIEVKVTEIEKSDEDDGDGREENTPYGYREMHLAAKSGDFGKLKSIFTRSSLVPTCGRFMAEHRDKNDKKRTLLHQVAEGGSLEGVRYLVTEQCANISAKDEDGDMAMHLAARANHPEIVKFLLDSKSQLVNVRGRYDQSVLYIASGQAESLDLVRYLVDDLKADINQPENTIPLSPLICAASKGNLDIVKFLCERGANLLAKDKQGCTALHHAVESGHLEVVKVLLSKTCENLEWTVCSNYQETPLCIAARKGHLDIVDYLVTFHHANLEHVDGDGFSPILSAARSGSDGSLAVVKFLLQKGANVHAKTGGNWYGRAIIHIAASGGCVELVQFLLNEYPAFLEMRDERLDGTAMHWAAVNGCLEVVRLLVEHHGVSPDIRDKYDTSPLFDAVQSNGRLPVVKYLLEKGATLQFKDCEGKNVLHYAIDSKDPQIITFLLDNDPSLVNQADTKGETPLQLATKIEKLPDEILKILKERASLSQS